MNCKECNQPLPPKNRTGLCPTHRWQAYYKKNHEKYLKQMKEYRKAHRQELNQYQREYLKKHRAENREKSRKYSREWARQHRLKFRKEYNKYQWRLNLKKRLKEVKLKLKKMIVKRWSKNYPYLLDCQRCHETGRPHYSKGMCYRCYTQEYRKEKPAKPEPGHTEAMRRYRESHREACNRRARAYYWKHRQEILDKANERYHIMKWIRIPNLAVGELVK